MSTIVLEDTFMFLHLAFDRDSLLPFYSLVRLICVTSEWILLICVLPDDYLQ